MTVNGVGIGFRKAIAKDILERDNLGISFLEIVPENYVGRGGAADRTLDELVERWPVLAHGVSLSLGGPDPFDDEYIRGLKHVLDRINAPFYTDHLCYATVNGFATHELLPMPFNEEAVRHTAGRIRELADRLERPIAVENIAYYSVMPGSTMSGAAFVRRVVTEANCGLLLDINNVFVNATNHGLEPRDVLLELPLDRTVQFHMAGHIAEGPRLLDNHGMPVDERVLDLYKYALERTGKHPTLLEWDLNIPSLDAVMDDVARVTDVYESDLVVVEPPVAALENDGSGTRARPLDTFFGEMRSFLLGENDAEVLQRRLGPSPTGTESLAFYPVFLRRHEHLSLGRQYPALKALLEHHNIDWRGVCQAFIRDNVPHHWSLHRMGGPMADWYQQRVEAGEPWPEEGIALADYAWTCWLARNAPADAPLIDGTVLVRHYPLDVRAWYKALVTEQSVPAEKEPCTLVVYRHAQGGQVRTLAPSIATFAVLERWSGASTTDWSAHGVSDGHIEREQTRLVKLGLTADAP